MELPNDKREEVILAMIEAYSEISELSAMSHICSILFGDEVAEALFKEAEERYMKEVQEAMNHDE